MKKEIEKDYSKILEEVLGPEISFQLMRAKILLDVLILVLIEKNIISIEDLNNKMGFSPEKFVEEVIEKIDSKFTFK